MKKVSLSSCWRQRTLTSRPSGLSSVYQLACVFKFIVSNSSRPSALHGHTHNRNIFRSYQSGDTVHDRIPIWTPEMWQPLYSGHFEMLYNTNPPLKWGHHSNQDTLTGPKGGQIKIHLWNEATPLFRPLWNVPMYASQHKSTPAYNEDGLRVAGLEGVHCSSNSLLIIRTLWESLD